MASADILVRFVGFPMNKGKLTNEQSQLLLSVVLPSAPDVAESVVLNDNVYKVVRRKWEFESTMSNTHSLMEGTGGRVVMNVYLQAHPELSE
jgi:hypothetical protein